MALGFPIQPHHLQQMPQERIGCCGYLAPPYSPPKTAAFQPITSATAISPFIEKHPSKRSQGNSWLHKGTSRLAIYSILDNSASITENELAFQLPELKKLLHMLRERREESSGGPGRGHGNVYLVGTGPGDPDLLTIKGLKVIQSADVLLYDRLVSNDVLSLAGPNARLLYVGKSAGYHSRTQEEIHELLLSFAEAGANVVRLKGGDPLVFGRGGEEMDFLQQQGIQVKVIPGITAATGIAAELGIPLTHRHVANSVQFLTGHSCKGEMESLRVAEHAAMPYSTLVVYMGLTTLPSLSLKLMQYGLPPDTPSVAVERGTTPHQRRVFAEIRHLVDEVTLANFVSPTLVIIGKVVSLSPEWRSEKYSSAVPVLAHSIGNTAA